MIYISSEPPSVAPAQDIVTFSFDKQRDYDEDTPLVIDAGDPSRSLAARTYKDLVEKLIAGFLALGLQPGDCVLTHVSNSYFYPAIFFSIVGARGIWCGSNPANKFFEVNHFVELARPRFIITEAETLPTVLEVCAKRQFPQESILVLDSTVFSTTDASNSAASDPPVTGQPFNSCPLSLADGRDHTSGPQPFISLLTHGSQPWQIFTTPSQSKQTPAAYFATSGTTGLPKLAVLSHHNLIHHNLSLHSQRSPIDDERKLLISLPFFHLFAFLVCFIQPLRYGQQTYVMRRWDLEKWVGSVKKFGIAETYAAPPMITAVTQAAKKDVHEVKNPLNSLRYIGIGGAPISAESVNVFRSLMHEQATVSNLMGLTEVGVATIFRHGENDETGSVGRLVGSYEAMLVDSEGEEQEGRGELWLKTQGRMIGYLGHDEEKGEWYATGDVCEITTEGKMYVVGRKKELIKVRGFQVAPAELEAVLLQHADIIDAAVVGVLDPDGSGEVPRAYIVRRQQWREPQRLKRDSVNSSEDEGGEQLTAQEVYHLIRHKLASYKALEGGVCFVEGIPRTPSGKIKRKELREMYEYNCEVVKQVIAGGKPVQDLANQSTVVAAAPSLISGGPSIMETRPSPLGGKVRELRAQRSERRERLKMSGGGRGGRENGIRRVKVQKYVAGERKRAQRAGWRSSWRKSEELALQGELQV